MSRRGTYAKEIKRRENDMRRELGKVVLQYGKEEDVYIYIYIEGYNK